MPCPEGDLHLFSVVDVFMTVVLPLSAGSTIIFVSLFRSWRACRSCLVIFDDGGLALRRITAICIRMLSAWSDGSLFWESIDGLYLTDDFLL